MLSPDGVGDELFNLERYEDALESTEKALFLQPGSRARLSHGLGRRALQALGQIEAAEQHFRHILKLNPGNTAALVNLAGLWTAQQRFDEAGEYMQHARELDPVNTAALQYLAEAFRKERRHEQAIELYRAMLNIDPDFAMTHAGLGDALFKLQRYEEAIGSPARSVVLHSEPPAATARLVLMGQASQALSRAEVAVEHFERAVKRDPRGPIALDFSRQVPLRQQRYEKAVALYRTMLEAGRSTPQAHFSLSATLAQVGRPDAALRGLEHARVPDLNLKSARTGPEQLRESLREGE